MAKMAREQEAAYALGFGVARNGLPPDAQLAYDRLLEQRARAAVVRAIGVALIAVGGIVVAWAFAQFAAEGVGVPIPGEPNSQRLTVRGPYRYVRNPLYVASAVAIGGAGPATRLVAPPATPHALTSRRGKKRVRG